MINELKGKQKELQLIYNKNKKLCDNFSIARGITFIILFIFFIMSLVKKDNQIIYICITISLLIAFIVLVIIHHKYNSIVSNSSYKLSCIHDYEYRSSDKWKSFNDNGMEFYDEKKYYEADLDLFGRNSLFQYLNLGKTGYGKYYLANSLLDKDVTKEELNDRQEAISELANNVDMHLSLEASSKKYEHKNPSAKYQSIESGLTLVKNEVNYNKSYLFIALALSLALVAAIVLSILKVITPYSIVLVLIINFFAGAFISNPVKELANNLIPVKKDFYGINHLIDDITTQSFSSKLLVEYQNEVKKMNSKAIKMFNFIDGLVSSSNNFIYNVIFNSTIFINYYVLIIFNKWQKKYSNYLEESVQAIGHIEELVSLSGLKLSKELVTMPKLSKNFKFQDLKHPLIEEENCVSNTFDFKGLNIITGSNMSGKTTFMRCVGINYLLFKAGTYVIASKFEAGFYKLFTSMKVTDDIANGISTFYGEVLRVKEIVDYIPNNQPMLVLIDEIFKGTNTLDRIEGATALVKKLEKDNIKAIITTHDYELCELNNVSNYHFLEHYQDDKILFDYKIREGRSTTKNAIYLMKIAGIIEE